MKVKGFVFHFLHILIIYWKFDHDPWYYLFILSKSHIVFSEVSSNLKYGLVVSFKNLDNSSDYFHNIYLKNQQYVG